MRRFPLLLLLIVFGCSPDDFQKTYALEGNDLYPEGLAFDPTTERFLVGSATLGKLTAIATDGEVSRFADPIEQGWSTLGLAVDNTARIVWACASPIGEADNDGADALWRFDADTGADLGIIDLGSIDPRAQCNDVIVDAEGIAFVTDPTRGKVYRIDPDASEAITVFAEGEIFESSISGTGPNGLAFSPDGQALIVGTLIPAQLIQVPLADPSSPVQLTLAGDNFAAGNPLAGPDGLIVHDGDLVVVMVDRIFRIALSTSDASGVVTRIDNGNRRGLSTATVAGGHLYVVKSNIDALLLRLAPDLPFELRRIDR